MEDGYLTLAQARERLGGISKAKMSSLIAEGELTVHPNKLDARSKLVRAADLERFIASGAVARRRRTSRTHQAAHQPA